MKIILDHIISLVKIQNNDEQETDKSLTIYEGIIALNKEVVEREAKETVHCSSFVNLSFTKLRDLQRSRANRTILFHGKCVV